MTKTVTAPQAPLYQSIVRRQKTTFTENLIFLRERAGLTQAEMTRHLGHGIKLKTYQSWEEKRGFPPIFCCGLIALALGVALNDMLTRNLKLETLPEA